MKIFISALFLSCFATVIWGQNSIVNNNNANQNGNSRPNQIMTIRADYSDVSAEGSPYLIEDYMIGNIHMNGKFERKASLRYNAFRDDIEVLNDDNSAYILLKRDYITVDLNNNHFEIVKFNDKKEIRNGYLIKLTNIKDVDNATLYLRPTKKLIKPKEPKSGFETYVPARYVENFSYYLKSKEGEAKKIKLSKKSLLGALGDYKKLLISYIDQNKLNLKNQNDAIELINYYNSL